MTETHKQFSLVDEMFEYIFSFGPLGYHLYKIQENLLHVGRLQRPTCSGFWDINLDVFLEAQDK